MGSTTEVKSLSELLSTTSYHFIPTVKARVRKTDKAEIWKECGNTGTSGSCGQHLGEATCVPHDLQPFSWARIPGRDLCTGPTDTEDDARCSAECKVGNWVQLGWGSMTGRARRYNMVMLTKKIHILGQLEATNPM